MSIFEFMGENKATLAFTLVVMIAVSVAYLAFGAPESMASSKVGAALFSGAEFKVAFTPDGAMKVFALSRNNALSRMRVFEGDPIPEEGSMVVGFTEAGMMKSEGMFSNPGDRLSNFFGIDSIAIGGVIAETGTVVDEVHFVSGATLDAIDGEQGRVFVRTSPEGVPKLFYTLELDGARPALFPLAEGSLSAYEIHDLDGTPYYPVVLGSKEAQMMRSEKLFASVGDSIRGFFGKDVVIVGVLSETNSSMDMAHFTPLSESDFPA